MGGLSKQGQHQSTGPPTYEIIKVPNVNHMSVMKTSLTIFPCVLGSAFPIIRVCPGLSFATKNDWATLLHFIYFCYLLLVTIYLITKLSVITYFSTFREYLAENRLSFPSAPRWVRHSYLSKELDRSPILVGHQDSFLARCRGVKHLW